MIYRKISIRKNNKNNKITKIKFYRGEYYNTDIYNFMTVTFFAWKGY